MDDAQGGAAIVVGFEDFDGGTAGFQDDRHMTIGAVITRTQEGDDRATLRGAGGFECEEVGVLVGDASGHVFAVAVGAETAIAAEVHIL